MSVDGREPWLLATLLLVFAVAAVDIPNHHLLFGQRTSAIGTTIGALAVFVSTLGTRRGAASSILLRRLAVALTALGMWVAFSTLLRSPDRAAAQNVVVLGSFLLLVLGGALGTLRLPGSEQLGALAGRCAMASSAVYLLSVARTGAGNSSLYGARSVALALCAALPLVLRATTRSRLLIALLMMGAILGSLSRTALLASLVAVVIYALNRSRLNPARTLAAGALGSAALLGLVLLYSPLADRFTQGDASLNYGGIAYNTSGRLPLWRAVFADARSHAWLGLGPGSSEAFVKETFPGIDHPHNDYLRLFHDYGLVGVSLFVVVVLLLMRLVITHSTPLAARRSLLISTLVLLLLMTTDNVLTYAFVLWPLGLAISAACLEVRLGSSAEGDLPEDPPRRSRQSVDALTISPVSSRKMN